MLFKRKLNFILFGNTGTGKTTLAKFLTDKKFRPKIEVEPTKKIIKYSINNFKLDSSRNSSILSRERYRTYKLNIIDIPGSFEDRRIWRDAFKKGKKPYAVVLLIDPFQSIPETQSALEDVYNKYLESISKDIEKADLIAGSSPLLLLLVLNSFSEKGDLDEDVFYDSALKNTLNVIKQKIPPLLVDVIKIDLYNDFTRRSRVNAVIERIKRFYYDQEV